jgi:hypothetical protein
MKTREILSTLLEVSKSLEDQSYVREADKVHNLMVRVAQMSLPLKPVVPKGFWETIGDSLGGAAKAIGKGVGKGVGNIIKQTPGFIDKSLSVTAPVAKLVDHAVDAIPKFVQKQKQDAKKEQDYQDRQQNQYQIGVFLKKYTDDAYYNLRANPTKDNLIKVRLDMKNAAERDSNYAVIDALSQAGNYYGTKAPVLKHLVDALTQNLPKDLLRKIQVNADDEYFEYYHFDDSGLPTWTDGYKDPNRKVFVPPYGESSAYRLQQRQQ